MSKPFHYLDNGSTVYPKPKCVTEEMVRFYNELGVNPGRGAFEKAKGAAKFIDDTRCILAEFFGGDTPERLIYTANSTDSLNMAISGLARDGYHVISTCLEHNSVLRPLNHLAREGTITVDYLPLNEEGVVSAEQVRDAVRPDTKMVVVNHASNVFGTVCDLEAIGAVCEENELIFIVDTSQTAGILPIDVERMKIDICCFTGHKSLLGPTGIGGLYILKDCCDVEAFRVGGTGIASADPYQPKEFPYRLEAGTANTIGIAGLRAGVEWIQKQGMDKLHQREMALASRLVEGVRTLEGVTVFFADSPRRLIPVVSIRIQRVPPLIAGGMLDEMVGVASRCGCHCAPLAHKSIGTYPEGTIRMSVGPFTTEDDIEAAIKGVTALATGQEKAS
ncbi:MAG: aminotransferase class V-fold PLP-dependent enzyme [Planctomycetota bacterium]|nr:aminotransferase class V-fold PLP-dependent enzyme [Planctomycetota bacterium]